MIILDFSFKISPLSTPYPWVRAVVPLFLWVRSTQGLHVMPRVVDAKRDKVQPHVFSFIWRVEPWLACRHSCPYPSPWHSRPVHLTPFTFSFVVAWEVAWPGEDNMWEEERMHARTHSITWGFLCPRGNLRSSSPKPFHLLVVFFLPSLLENLREKNYNSKREDNKEKDQQEDGRNVIL